MSEGETRGEPPVSEAQSNFLGIAPVRFSDRFLEVHVGRNLLNDPVAALVELIANAWDAGATLVEIQWPQDGNGRLIVKDNGTGMTAAQFDRRWLTLNYNRAVEQGTQATFPPDAPSTSQRVAFGRNGLGRWAGFCFGSTFLVTTSADGLQNVYKVSRALDRPFEVTRLQEDVPTARHGTEISVESARFAEVPATHIRSEIGMRFLTDPLFEVRVNGETVDFEDIRDAHLETIIVETAHGHALDLIVIDTGTTDRTSRQHGVAWHVSGRLVGTCSWSGARGEAILDRRRIAARRFTFIVRADHLAELGAVSADWSSFHEDSDAYLDASSAAYDAIEEYLHAASEEDRRATYLLIEEENQDRIAQLTPLRREAWSKFITEVQERCASIKETDLVKLGEIMATLELSQSSYQLIDKLFGYGPDELDELNRILDEWTLDMAKIVLDEIARRLRLIETLATRTENLTTREVQDLQPLFESALWVFGPEFETIEYTSNVGMRRVVQDVFGANDLSMSRSRPDFVVLPDSSVSLMTLPDYDADGEEVGVSRLVVVELKKPGIRIGEEQKSQCWGYVKELFERGHLVRGVARVRCFVLGSAIDEMESSPRVELDGTVQITPILFPTVVRRAKGRMLRLHDRVKEAPYLQQHRAELDAFLEPQQPPDSQTRLDVGC